MCKKRFMFVVQLEVLYICDLGFIRGQACTRWVVIPRGMFYQSLYVIDGRRYFWQIYLWTC